MIAATSASIPPSSTMERFALGDFDAATRAQIVRTCTARTPPLSLSDIPSRQRLHANSPAEGFRASTIARTVPAATIASVYSAFALASRSLAKPMSSAQTGATTSASRGCASKAATDIAITSSDTKALRRGLECFSRSLIAVNPGSSTAGERGCDRKAVRTGAM